ncbi:MAG: WecB/TagA/CpsF family glycosyltransferase [Lentimicrobiaceae bacterium]|jgi:N-acetylglucosaminyldiphosphoundecaprenol N-acetyl-beta-D-mannosaminyltransferase|nr:WecB/TagA/CpsF family glycosyltransferase [Lentimicrobiaceae bacterium]
MLKINVLGFDILSEPLNEDFFNEKCIVNTINASAFVWSKNDHLYHEALLASNLLIPDGIAVTIAARFLYNKRIKKISAEDLFFFLIKSIDKEHGSCFFLGSSNTVIEKILNRLKFDHPDIKAAGFSPPFRNFFSEEEKRKMIQQVNTFSPKFLFVGLSAPKQEKLICEISQQLNAQIICNIGAVFDFYAETIKRPGKLWQKIGLEWLVLWLKDPVRLNKKEYLSIIKFIYSLFKVKFNKK